MLTTMERAHRRGYEIARSNLRQKLTEMREECESVLAKQARLSQTGVVSSLARKEIQGAQDCIDDCFAQLQLE